MYTDWGNLKIVSCGAWLEGRTRQLNVVPWNGRIGGVHFGVNAAGCGVGPDLRLHGACGPIGRCREVQVF